MMIDRDLGKAAFCFVAILTVALPSSAEVILLATQHPFSLTDNATLVIEDVDPQQSMVWMEIYNQSRNETLKSTVLGLGEHFNFSETDLTVNNIYTGGLGDLVSIEIRRNVSRIPLGSPAASR